MNYLNVLPKGRANYIFISVDCIKVTIFSIKILSSGKYAVKFIIYLSAFFPEICIFIENILTYLQFKEIINKY